MIRSLARSTSDISDFYKLPKPKPVSIADAFYSFDNHVLDLQSKRDGTIVGGLIGYADGYVAYGKAAVFDQSSGPTFISISPGFELSMDSSFTIEAFFMLYKVQMTAVLIQLTPAVSLQLIDGLLGTSLRLDKILIGQTVISADQWHHFALVYHGQEQTIKLFIDGSLELSNSSIPIQISAADRDAKIIVGSRYQGRIDQLAVTMRAKSNEEILWDATAVTYQSFEDVLTYDSGPHGQNASVKNPVFIRGWRNSGLNFNESNSFYRIDGLGPLGIPYRAFSIALWVRAESQPGIFLTVSNRATCLFVLGIAAGSNAVVAYLPNATVSGKGVRIQGPVMPAFAWANIAFTWSAEQHAQLYASTFSHPGGSDAAILNHARGGDDHRAPMMVTLGEFDATGPCRGIQEASVNTTTPFRGSLDELYVFSRELLKADLEAIVKR